MKKDSIRKSKLDVPLSKESARAKYEDLSEED